MKQPYRPNNGNTVRLKIIIPDKPIRLQDLPNLNEILRADIYEGQRKTGSFKISDIKRKFL
jgi:hypothetical protein